MKNSNIFLIVYGPFFGVMGAASAIIFTCKFKIEVTKKVSEIQFKRSRRIIRNCKVWYWNRGNECHATWADHEIDHSCGYGWYRCNLRSRRCNFDRRTIGWAWDLHSVQVKTINSTVLELVRAFLKRTLVILKEKSELNRIMWLKVKKNLCDKIIRWRNYQVLFVCLPNCRNQITWQLINTK